MIFYLLFKNFSLKFTVSNRLAEAPKTVTFNISKNHTLPPH